MPRKKVCNDLVGPYHISSRCINQEWFSIPMKDVWSLFSDHLFFLHHAYGIEIHSFVLMSNHYHLIASAPGQNLSYAMMNFQREVSRELNRLGNRINRTFAGRFFRSYLGTYHYFLNCYKYVYLNPLISGQVSKVEDYPFSSLHGLLGSRNISFPVREDEFLFDGNTRDNLSWLNGMPDEEHLDTMRLGLKKGVFQLRKDLKTRKSHILENERL